MKSKESWLTDQSRRPMHLIFSVPKWDEIELHFQKHMFTYNDQLPLPAPLNAKRFVRVVLPISNKPNYRLIA